MTALAADRKRRIRNDNAIQKHGTTLAADSITGYAGGIGSFNGSGKIAVGADTAGHKAAGVIAEKFTSAGSNTTVYPQLEYGHEEWFVNDGNITSAMVGKDAVILDDQTVSNAGTTTNDVPLGIIKQLETIDGVAGVWVQVGVFSGTLAP